MEVLVCHIYKWRDIHNSQNMYNGNVRLWKWSLMRRWRDDPVNRWIAEKRISLEGGWMSFETPSMPVHPLHTSVCSSHEAAANSIRNRTCVRSPLRSTQKHLSPHTGHMPCNTSPLWSPSPHLAFMSFSLSVLFLLSLMECQGLAYAPAAQLHGHTVSFCNCPLQTHSHLYTH